MSEGKTLATRDVLDEALTPRPVFLWVAAVFATLAVLAFLFQDSLNAGAGGTAYVVLLSVLVLLSLLAILCYRLPRLGNRLLGHGTVLEEAAEKRINPGYHFTGSFKVDTGAAVKRQASRRKQARAERRQWARATKAPQHPADKSDTP